jgi:carbon-monoxide dehydrogenase small subunit
MIISAKALLDEIPDPSDAQIKRGISGNLCRCTGYVQIVESIKKAAGELQTRG